MFPQVVAGMKLTRMFWLRGNMPFWLPQKVKVCGAPVCTSVSTVTFTSVPLPSRMAVN